MISGLDHVAIGVPDLDAALDFYLEALDAEVVFRSDIAGDRPDADKVVGIDGLVARAAMLRFGAQGSQVEVWQYADPEIVDRRSPPNGLGYPHIALRVTDIDAEHERLSGIGMTFVGPPVDLGWAKAIYGTDPFGNIIELLEELG